MPSNAQPNPLGGHLFPVSPQDERLNRPLLLCVALLKELHSSVGQPLPDPKSLETRPRELKALQKRRERQRVMCQEFLDRLADANEWPEYDAQQKAVARSELLLYLATTSSERETEGDLHKQALVVAKESKDRLSIYLSHLSLGDYFREGRLYDQAIKHYQDALLYAWGLWPNDAIQVFMRLAETFAAREETLSQAVFFYEWAGRVRPWAYEARCRAAECCIRLGEQAQLCDWTEKAEPTTCDEIVSVIAVLTALGRRKKLIERLALQGLHRSEEEHDSHWQFLFHWLAGLPQQTEQPLPQDEEKTNAA
jgi:hypothetical protein